jgi:CBS domain-containing protein
MEVASIMRADPVTITAAASLDEALRLMDRHDIRHLPVLEDGALSGMLSDRDLLESTGWRRSGNVEPDGRVRAHMRMPVETIGLSIDVATAAAELVQSRANCLAVMDDGGLAGLVSDSDFLHAYVSAVRSGQFRREHDVPVITVAVRDLIAGTPETSIAEARELLRNHRIRHLPLLERGHVVALVSDRDLRLAIGRGSSLDAPIGSLVPRSIISIEPRARLSHAAELMLLHSIGSLVVGEGTQALGILTSSDVLDHAANLSWNGRRSHGI